MTEYTNIRATAKRLIAKKGRLVTFTKQDRTPLDADRPWLGVGTNDTAITVKAAFIAYEAEDVDGDNIRFSDKRALVSAQAVEEANSSANLETFDFVNDGGVKWKIQKVDAINPGDEDIVFDVQLRK